MPSKLSRARASNAAVKPEPGRAQGTLSRVVLPQSPQPPQPPQSPQATRGMSACGQASNWKQSRGRQELRRRLRTGCAAALKAGQFGSAPDQMTSKSMRLDSTSSLTSLTTQGGGFRPHALVNSAATPTLILVLVTPGPWTCGQAQRTEQTSAKSGQIPLS